MAVKDEDEVKSDLNAINQTKGMWENIYSSTSRM